MSCFFGVICWNIILYCLTRKMMTPQSFDTSRATCPMAQNHVPEGVNVHKFKCLCLFIFCQSGCSAVNLDMKHNHVFPAYVMTHLLLHNLKFFRRNLCGIINDLTSLCVSISIIMHIVSAVNSSYLLSIKL